MFSGSMPNLATSSAFVETATKCFAIAASSPSAASAQARAECAFVIVSSVVNVFDETMKRVSSGCEVARRLDEVGRVDVRDEAEREVAPRVVPERLVGHHRPEVGAADADVHDVADRLARVALPLARAHALGERGHAVEHLVDVARRRRRPSTTSDRSCGMRSATWRTERFSVVLIRSPRNIASVRSGRPDSSASWSRSRSVSSVTRFFE